MIMNTSLIHSQHMLPAGAGDEASHIQYTIMNNLHLPYMYNTILLNITCL